MFEDLDVLDVNYYDRFTRTIAASKQAKIKYILAAIMYDEALVRIMSGLYPEMKQYFPLVKDQMNNQDDDIFGMYCRGSLSFGKKNVEASVEYLTNVIENPDIIIVGGSDEADFVYETIENHDLCPDPDMVEYGSKYSRFGVAKNGNYWVGYGDTRDYVRKKSDDCDDSDRDCIRDSFCGRIRFATSPDPIVPEYPELIDLKITDACDHGCPFCYMNATKNGKHADITFLQRIISGLDGHRVEFSIGGGNILLYPQLETFLKRLNECGHIVNVTIKADDCKKVIEDKDIHDIFRKYVDGIGVSITKHEECQCIIDLYNSFNGDNGYWNGGKNAKYIVAHLIPEYIGVDVTNKITEKLRKFTHWIPVLFLGYKSTGRGITQNVKEFNKTDLDNIFSEYNSSISVDTTFANRYMWYIKDHFSTKHTITLNEGEYSMYIDGVGENAYKSSYQLDKPYNMHVDWKARDEHKYYNVKEAFTEIRRDGGFTIYDDVVKHYWSDAKHYWEENEDESEK
jgi:MoaA/NifB/PqqE/SkfB family radical SAM enzyme